jgi:hypothetical protein
MTPANQPPSIKEVCDYITDEQAKTYLMNMLESKCQQTNKSRQEILQKILGLLEYETNFEKFEEALMGPESDWKRRVEVLCGRGATCSYPITSIIRSFRNEHRTHITGILAGLIQYSRTQKKADIQTPPRPKYEFSHNIPKGNKTTQMEILGKGASTQR